MSAEHPSPTHVDARQDSPSEFRRMPALEALGVAKAHFMARGWRPVAIQPPMLAQRCRDVSMVLLMNDVGETAWLSARDWSMAAHPVDAFAREMACVRAAKVEDVILVHDGEFPDAVVEMAAQQPRIKLIDAVGLQAMSGGVPSASPKAAPLSHRERLMRPARNAVASVHARATRMMDQHVLPATERFVSRRLAQTLREVDGERRRLHKLVTGGMVVVGLALGFLLFNLAIFRLGPDEAPAPRMADNIPPATLPAPMPPAEGYVARAAGVGHLMAARMVPAHSTPAGPGLQPSLSSLHAVAFDAADTTANAAVSPGLDDYALAQMRADEAMRVIAHDTPEVDAASRVADAWRRENAAVAPAPSAAPSPADPARVEDDMVDADPAIVD